LFCYATEKILDRADSQFASWFLMRAGIMWFAAPSPQHATLPMNLETSENLENQAFKMVFAIFY